MQCEIVEFRREPLRAEHLPVDGESDHIRAILDMFRDALAFLTFDELVGARCGMLGCFLVGDLVDAQFAEA